MQKSGAPFFLTGGTALSRYYTHHRYSDDLDFFVNNTPAYSEHVDTILRLLFEGEAAGLFTVDRLSVQKGQAYTQLFVTAPGKQRVDLKVEFINDVSAHYGVIAVDPVLGRVDSLENILSSKLTALFRTEPKDVVDIHAIALKMSFNWKDIVAAAKSKEVGADPEALHGILMSFPEESLDTIKWITRPAPSRFMQELRVIAGDILYGLENSLAASD